MDALDCLKRKGDAGKSRQRTRRAPSLRPETSPVTKTSRRAHRRPTSPLTTHLQGRESRLLLLSCSALRRSQPPIDFSSKPSVFASDPPPNFTSTYLQNCTSPRGAKTTFIIPRLAFKHSTRRNANSPNLDLLTEGISDKHVSNTPNTACHLESTALIPPHDPISSNSNFATSHTSPSPSHSGDGIFIRNISTTPTTRDTTFHNLESQYHAICDLRLAKST
jgi:hypothetical protein